MLLKGPSKNNYDDVKHAYVNVPIESTTCKNLYPRTFTNSHIEPVLFATYFV